MSASACAGKTKTIIRPTSKATYLFLRSQDVNGNKKILCCSVKGNALDCNSDLPADTEEMIGLYPARHNELVKCCNFQNLLDKTEPDK